jgi:hypothetical protein
MNYFGEASNGIWHLNAYKLLRTRCYGGAHRKLGQLIDLAGYGNSVEGMFRKVLGANADQHLRFHDALFDAFSLWVLLSANKSRLGIDGI